MSQEFLDLLFSNSFVPTITKPTRVTSSSATLIDNIYCNAISNNNDNLSGILYTDITDHFSIFYIDSSGKTKDPPKTIKHRVYSPQNIAHFNTNLSNYDWSSIYNIDDPQEAYSTFHSQYSDMYNVSFPLKEKKIGYKTRKPWLSVELKRVIAVKNRLYRRSLRDKGNDEAKVLYKKFRNKVNRLILKAEKEYYDRIFKENSDNLKKSWRILKEVINKKKTVSINSRFNINGTITTNKNTISNRFNSIFCKYRTRTCQKNPPSRQDPCSLLTK